ncbi:MAG: type II CAAX endopeptidase family protein [Bacteroidales bacterium]|nr:type II CAAX endopeptidase family protein [Bacteroidales bacterium]
MLKRYSSYLPDLTQSWILIMLLALAGSILGGLVSFILMFFFPGFKGWGELIMYPLIFIPPYLAIRISLKNRAKNITNTDYEPLSVPIDKPDFGKIGALATILLTIPLVFSINIITEPLTMWMDVPEFLKQFLEQVQSNKISSFIAVVVFAPILEEIFCRGIILRGLLAHMSPSKAILWSALMFGIMHMNPWQAIPAFILGLLMGWIYYKTHSIWIVILIHFINNGFSYLITVFFPELPAETGFYDLIPGMWYYISYIAAFIYTALVLHLMNKYYDKTISLKIQPNS